MPIAFRPGFNALFRNGVKTKEIDLGMTMEEVEKLDKKFFAEGFQLRFLLQFYGDGSWQAAWEKGDGGTQHWLVTQDEKELLLKDQEHFKNGLRLKYLHQQGGTIVAIWRPGGGGQSWEVNIGFDEFSAKDEEFRNQGFVLMSLCDDEGKYTALWQSGKKKYTWISTGHFDAFQAEVALQKDRGRLGVSFAGDIWTVVFHEEAGEQHFVTGLTSQEMKQRSEEFFKQGFHIVDLHMTA
jgi:polyglycine hydrolase-like protein